MPGVEDFHITCWFCGQNHVKPENDYFQCSKCGATLTDLPKPLSTPPMVRWKDSEGHRHFHPAGIPS